MRVNFILFKMISVRWQPLIESALQTCW